MDAEKILNKRWFLRPVAAYYAGHKKKPAKDKI
jgi:hypothetical protein